MEYASDIEKELKYGKIIAVPYVNSFMASIQGGDTQLSVGMYDELRYNHNSMTYETKLQTEKIRNLERQLAEKELQKISKENNEIMELENLIAYYYSR